MDTEPRKSPIETMRRRYRTLYNRQSEERKQAYELFEKQFLPDHKHPEKTFW